jgi:hypothetical protein
VSKLGQHRANHFSRIFEVFSKAVARKTTRHCARHRPLFGTPIVTKSVDPLMVDLQTVTVVRPN